MYRLTRVVAICCVTVISSTSHAQSTATELPLHREQLNFAINKLGTDNKTLYNGPEYIPTQAEGGGNNFFIAQKLSEGTITYNGIFYPDVMMAYDLFQDQVIVEVNGSHRICPGKERINAFTLYDHHFKYIENISILPPGFYDFLYDGSTSLCVKRKKVLRGFQWHELTSYYIIHADKRVSLLHNKKTLLAAFNAESQKNLKHFIAENKIKFGRDKEKSFARVVEFYVNLKK